jgi:hypothetical protein
MWAKFAEWAKHLIDDHSKLVVYFVTMPSMAVASLFIPADKYSTFITGLTSLAIGFFVGKGMQEHAEAKFAILDAGDKH